MNPFKLIYKFCSHPQIKFWLQVLHTVIGLYLTLYALAFAKYEFTLFSIDNKIVNFVTLAEGQNRKFVLERISSFQQTKVPVEPKIYNIFSIIKSLIPTYDNINLDLWKELSILVAYYKSDLRNLVLNDINLSGLGILYYDIDFTNSHFEKVSLFKATLNFNDFQHSQFINVNFFLTNLRANNFSFSKFIDSNLDHADFTGSNLCGIKLYNTSYYDTNFSYTNLIGVDLSDIMMSPFPEENPYTNPSITVQNAYYNSKNINIFSEPKIVTFLSLLAPSCLRGMKNVGFVPTKFPKGFKPEKYGMIDISKTENIDKLFSIAK